MTLVKKISLGLLAGFITIQFIQPAHNKTEQVLPTDLTKVFVVPGNIQSVLQAACYDCHSNNTNYPWYSNIQPIGWMMAKHIKKGKEKLNFSDFGHYAIRMQISKLKETANQVRDDEMPILSYRMMHRNTRLSKADKELLTDWLNKITDSLASKDQMH